MDSRPRERLGEHSEPQAVGKRKKQHISTMPTKAFLVESLVLNTSAMIKIHNDAFTLLAWECRQAKVGFATPTAQARTTSCCDAVTGFSSKTGLGAGPR